MKTIRIAASDYAVTSVVVLKSSKAEVVRTFGIELKEGRNKLIISKLPTTIEKQSVRTKIVGKDGTSVENKTYLSDAVCSLMDNAEVDPTTNTIRALELKKSGLESEKKMLDTQAEVMVTYARSLTGEFASPDAVDAFLDAFNVRGKKNIEAVMRIEEQIMEVDKKIQEEKRKKTLVKGSVNMELAVMIIAESDTQIQFHLTYVVNNTKWSPSYELHAVTSEDGKPSRMVSLHYHASIKQATGENWTDASLTLSTVATDTVTKNIPVLEPVEIYMIPSYVHRPQAPVIIQESRSRTPPVHYHRAASSVSPRRHRSRSHSRAHSPRSRRSRSHSPQVHVVPISFRVPPGFAAAQERETDDDAVFVLSDDGDEDDDALEINARGRRKTEEALTKMVTQTPMTLTYAVRGKADIPSDGKEHTVTVAILTFEADIEYVSVPRVDPRVFLQCQVKNTSEYRLLPGPVSVILDNNYVSRTRFSDVKRNDTFTFTLGDDPSITISYERLSKIVKEGTHTFAESIDITTYATTITAHNTHQFSIEKLVVRDAVPVSANDQRIKVLLRKPQELLEAQEGVFVDVKDAGKSVEPNTSAGEEGMLKVRWEKEQDGLYEYKWGVGAENTAKFETTFDVKGPADLKYSFANFDIKARA
ncbi:hypothetical protein P691DRAFT_665264 [Macrolepiota fuliginosa MF-IS2]|uniref:Mucoidy inhibitor A n=1 Tax=Macrolepiota fuliginosa MF-IS2 TaxID=1400762 RepID=A0A9P5XJ28_9AGAR|nr:hypothetical protein P691DRAFT_665264 [Macrolepiota fuliginosa MF-IS2]